MHKPMFALGAISLAALATAAPAAARQGDVLMRVRTILVAPNETSGGILPSLPAEEVAVGNSVMPEIDFTYMATDHLGLELIAATTNHSIFGKSGVTGSIGKLASTWVLPPTLTLQYHFNPGGHIRPYAGIGLNYSVFWNEDASGSLEAAVGRTHVRLSDSVGWALQAGTDIDLDKRFFLNLDFKYIDMSTSARLDTAALGVQKVKVEINPIVVGVGVGVRF